MIRLFNNLGKDCWEATILRYLGLHESISKNFFSYYLYKFMESSINVLPFFVLSFENSRYYVLAVIEFTSIMTVLGKKL